MVRPGHARHPGRAARARGGSIVVRRWLRNPLVWSPIAAFIAQLLITTAVAAVTGGGDFPLRR